MIKVWDPVVRFFHWGLAACFALAWLTAEESTGVHIWLGYAVAALVAIRLIWGLIGSRYARFSQFVRGPGAVLGYLRAMLTGRERRHIGHNPAGAAMVVALLLTLWGTALTGWMMADPARQSWLPSIATPAFADDDEGHERGGEGGLEEVHEALATLALVLVGLHLGGVALASVRHRENLARAMVTGTKRPAAAGDID